MDINYSKMIKSFPKLLQALDFIIDIVRAGSTTYSKRNSTTLVAWVPYSENHFPSFHNTYIPFSATFDHVLRRLDEARRLAVCQSMALVAFSGVYHLFVIVVLFLHFLELPKRFGVATLF